ncbi:hypothetical protein, partial [Novosphingobium chloroacetimidivorans]|uniref:hypothetical protein n=1 Tax=Novosphingobium chloroacetimidivorans TaxID=1428314 RepID=UPI001FE95188
VSASCSIASCQTNAPTSSKPQDINAHAENALEAASQRAALVIVSYSHGSTVRRWAADQGGAERLGVHEHTVGKWRRHCA